MGERLAELLDQARAGLTIEEACEFTPLARDEIDRAQEAEKVWRSAAEKWEANCDKADAEVKRLEADIALRDPTAMVAKANAAGMERAARYLDDMASKEELPTGRVRLQLAAISIRSLSSPTTHVRLAP